METKTFHSEVTSQSSSSRVCAASHPFPPFEGKVTPVPGRSSTCQIFLVGVPWDSDFTEAKFRSATIPGFPTPGFLPFSPPSSRSLRERQDGGRWRLGWSSNCCGISSCTCSRPEPVAGLEGAAAGRAGGDWGLPVVRGGAGTALRSEGPAEAVWEFGCGWEAQTSLGTGGGARRGAGVRGRGQREEILRSHWRALEMSGWCAT